MKRQQKYSKPQMYALIRKWESSGISQVDFSRQHGIAKSTFGYWRRKYLRETGNSSKKGSFIPVKVESPNKFSMDTTGMIEIIYPNGVRMVCPAGMDLSRLHSVLR